MRKQPQMTLKNRKRKILSLINELRQKIIDIIQMINQAK